MTGHGFVKGTGPSCRFSLLPAQPDLEPPAFSWLFVVAGILYGDEAPPGTSLEIATGRALLTSQLGAQESQSLAAEILLNQPKGLSGPFLPWSETGARRAVWPVGANT
jgi:hypothetical protein